MSSVTEASKDSFIFLSVVSNKTPFWVNDPTWNGLTPTLRIFFEKNEEYLVPMKLQKGGSDFQKLIIEKKTFSSLETVRKIVDLKLTVEKMQKISIQLLFDKGENEESSSSNQVETELVPVLPKVFVDGGTYSLRVTEDLGALITHDSNEKFTQYFFAKERVAEALCLHRSISTSLQAFIDELSKKFHHITEKKISHKLSSDIVQLFNRIPNTLIQNYDRKLQQAKKEKDSDNKTKIIIEKLLTDISSAQIRKVLPPIIKKRIFGNIREEVREEISKFSRKMADEWKGSNRMDMNED